MFIVKTYPFDVIESHIDFFGVDHTLLAKLDPKHTSVRTR